MAAINYVFKGVDELTDEDIHQYTKLFNTIFGENLSAGEFREKFTRRMGGGACFVLLVHESEGIIGSIGAIEVPYSLGGQRYKFALAVDGMIAPEHRHDWLALKRMHDMLVAELTKRDFVFLFTKPNNNSYLYLKQLGGLADIGDLIPYGLPLHPFGLIDRRLFFLDYPWLGLLRFFAWIAGLSGGFAASSADEIAPRAIARQGAGILRERDERFLRTRYENRRYRWLNRGGRFVIYTIRPYEGRSTCVVLEAPELKFWDWLAFLDHIFKTGAGVEILLHVVGRKKAHFPLVRIPGFVLPNKFHVVGKPLGKRVLPDTEKLNVDLSDFEMV